MKLNSWKLWNFLRFRRPSPPKDITPKEFGLWSEKQAVKLLKRNGYRIITTNFRSFVGEVDIVARDKDFIVFVEVKARRTNTHGLPSESVTRRKQHQISKTAAVFLKKYRLMNENVRFDVVSMDLSPGGRTEIIRDAFASTIY